MFRLSRDHDFTAACFNDVLWKSSQWFGKTFALSFGKKKIFGNTSVGAMAVTIQLKNVENDIKLNKSID